MKLVSPAEAIKPVEPVTEFPVDPKLIEEMTEIMKAHNGVGLAAPQVGVMKALFIFQIPGAKKLRVVCNPTMTVPTEKTVINYEGCLTLPEQRFAVERWKSVHMSGQDENGESFTWTLTGRIAVVCQHEYMHCFGFLIDGSHGERVKDEKPNVD